MKAINAKTHLVYIPQFRVATDWLCVTVLNMWHVLQVIDNIGSPHHTNYVVVLVAQSLFVFCNLH